MNKHRFRLFELVRDRAGIAAIEFALIVPILIVAFLGCFEVTDYVRATMRTDQVAQSVAELIADQNSVTNATGGAGSIADYCYAAQTVIVPYDPANLTVNIASYTVDASEVLQKDWAVTCPPNPPNPPLLTTTANTWSAAPATGTIPTSLYKYTGDSLILVNTTYNWLPPDGGLFLHSGITATETAYARPRSNSTISCTPPSTSSTC